MTFCQTRGMDTIYPTSRSPMWLLFRRQIRTSTSFWLRSFSLMTNMGKVMTSRYVSLLCFKIKGDHFQGNKIRCGAWGVRELFPRMVLRGRYPNDKSLKQRIQANRGPDDQQPSLDIPAVLATSLVMLFTICPAEICS